MQALVLLCAARFAGSFKLVALKPLDCLWLVAGKPPQYKSKLCQLGIPAEVPICLIFVGRLVVVVGHIILALLAAPLLGLPHKKITLVN